MFEAVLKLQAIIRGGTVDTEAVILQVQVIHQVHPYVLPAQAQNHQVQVVAVTGHLVQVVVLEVQVQVVPEAVVHAEVEEVQVPVVVQVVVEEEDNI
jgi:hypothetical protein